MSLWNLLAMISGCGAFGSALGAVIVLRRSGAQPSLAVGAIAAVVLGVLASSALVLLRTRIARVLPISGDAQTPTWLRLLYGGAALWTFVAAFVANLVTRALLAML